MVKVKKEGILLRPSNLSFENYGVFNPACIRKGDYVHMYYRAMNIKKNSVMGYCKLKGPLKIVEKAKKPILKPSYNYERNIEDPRIVLLNGIYYLTYVAYDGKNVRIAYATSKDLKKFKKKGVISPEITYHNTEKILRSCDGELKERYFLFEARYTEDAGEEVILWDKDAFLFPKKIKGKFALIHRILPDIQIIYFKDFKDLTLDYWKENFKRLCDFVVLESKYWYESRNIGGGCPPIETDKGWLLIYHAVDDINKGKVYRAGAALLDKDDPTKVIGHLNKPLFSPKKRWELKGNVDNVVFPTGAVLFGKRLYIYYGAADKYIAVASLNIDELLDELVKSKK